MNRKSRAAVRCALCWRRGHVAKLCPYTAIGKARQRQRGVHRYRPTVVFTIEFLEDQC